MKCQITDSPNTGKCTQANEMAAEIMIDGDVLKQLINDGRSIKFCSDHFDVPLFAIRIRARMLGVKL